MFVSFFQRATGSALLTLALLAVTSIGCGGKSELQPVKGKVVYNDGQPVAGGSITFNNSEKQLSASGDIASDGTFALKFGDQQGAPAGTYKVVVIGGSDTYGAPPTVAAIYGDPVHTPLTQSIAEGQTDLTITVERPK